MNNTDLDCIEDVKNALMQSADPLESGVDHDSRWGYGALNGENWLSEIRSSNIC